MLYLLDTNIFIYLTKGQFPVIADRVRTFGPGDIGISAVTLAELEFGIAKSSNPEKNRRRLQEFLLPFEVLPFESLAAIEYGEVRRHFEKSGSSIGPLDILIAAHAKSQGLCLVTNNEREFSRVPGLKTQNWTLPARKSKIFALTLTWPQRKALSITSLSSSETLVMLKRSLIFGFPGTTAIH